MPQNKNLTQICFSVGEPSPDHCKWPGSAEYAEGGFGKTVLRVLANWGKTAAVRMDGETVRLASSPGF